MSTISISLDGLNDTHNRIRGVKDGFQKVINGLNHLRRADFVEKVMLTTVVNKDNINELQALKEFLKSVPFDIWRICPVDEIGRAVDNNDILLSREQLYDVLEFIRRSREEGLPFKVITSCSHYLGSYEFLTREFPFSCQAGKTVCSILANGDIFVCPNVPRSKELIQGNVLTHDLFEVWKNGFSYFRNVESRHVGKCGECRYYSKCCGDSMHTWDKESQSPSFCAAELGLINDQPQSKLPLLCYNNIISNLKSKFGKMYCLKVDAQSNVFDRIVFTSDASEQMINYFDWDTAQRTNEKLCALYGNIVQDSQSNQEAFIVIVEKILPIVDVKASEKELEITEAIVNDALVNIDGKTLIGFAHTHPNELDIAMSLEDYKFHRQLFQKDWKAALTVIINPQKRHLAAFSGPSANHAELNLLFDESTFHQFNLSKK